MWSVHACVLRKCPALGLFRLPCAPSFQFSVISMVAPGLCLSRHRPVN